MSTTVTEKKKIQVGYRVASSNPEKKNKAYVQVSIPEQYPAKRGRIARLY